MTIKLLLLLLISAPCLGQTPNASSETTGPCSPAISGNQNEVRIDCRGITNEQRDEFLKILNKIVREQLDTKIVLVKLDEIQRGVSSIESELAARRQQEQEAERIRRTAPGIRVWLTLEGTNRVIVHMLSTNLIPFRYRCVLKTTNDTVVGGIPIEMSSWYPTAKTNPGYFFQDIQRFRITDNLLKMDFTFESLSYEELQLEGHFATITQKYRFDGDRLTLVDQVSNAEGGKLQLR